MYCYENNVAKPRNVVVYARVSTEHEAQLSALENQKDWYKPFLAQHPEWEVVGMYVDEGITGTSAKKRPQFMKMIEDAGSGKFDLILTREVSRFARNTVDTLQYTRELKSKGVEVFFINDNIKTFDGDGELRLTIMATLAQDESRKTSIRVKSGQQTSMENGVYYGNGNILGYDRVGKELIINEEQAKTVRMIYDWYLDGVGMRAIQFRLEQAGRLTSMGKTRWHQSNISKILKNSFYCGIITYHKEYTPDYLIQKKIRNFGDIELTQVKGTHTSIVTEEEFNRVQQIMSSRTSVMTNNVTGKRKELGKKPYGDVWTQIMECECGHKFNRKVWHKVNEVNQYGYQCYSSLRTGSVETRKRKGLPLEGICQTPMIPGWKLQMMVKYIFNNFISNKAEVLSLAESILEAHINDTPPENDNSELIARKIYEREKLNKRLDNLIEMRADGELSRDLFKKKKEEIESAINKIDDELERIQPAEEPEENIDSEEKIKMLKYYLEQSVIPLEDENLPEDIIKAFIKKVVAGKDHFDWYLRFPGDDDEPQQLTMSGKRKSSAVISSLCTTRHRQLLAKEGNNRIDKLIKVQEFVIDLHQAKAYLYSFSTKHRIYNWEDLNITVYL